MIISTNAKIKMLENKETTTILKIYERNRPEILSVFAITFLIFALISDIIAYKAYNTTAMWYLQVDITIIGILTMIIIAFCGYLIRKAGEYDFGSSTRIIAMYAYVTSCVLHTCLYMLLWCLSCSQWLLEQLTL